MTQKRLEFSALLARLRLERGLSIYNLAQTTRMTSDYFRAIEEGRCEPPRPISIMRLCKALSLTGAESELLHQFADAAREEKNHSVRLSRPAMRLIKTIERYAPALPDQFLIALRRMVREAAEH